jgi:hypothetical protein
MTDYILNTQNNYDLNFIPYGQIISGRLPHTPDVVIDYILYSLVIGNILTYDEYITAITGIYKYVFEEVSKNIIDEQEIYKFLLNNTKNIRMKIISIISKKQLDYSDFLWSMILEEFDKYMLYLLVNIPDETISIINNIYTHRDMVVRISHLDILRNSITEIEEFRRLYNQRLEVLRRAQERQTIYKVMYKSRIPTAINSIVDKYI